MDAKPTLAVSVAAGMLSLGLATAGVFAADHAEAPGTMADPAADITDLYAWVPEEDTLVVALDFAGLQEPGSTGTYDPDVLYGIHIDYDEDNEADVDIWVRFGQNALGEWGVQVVDFPGQFDPVEGPVDTIIDVGNGKVFAGPRDDPFFFDLDGYQATLMTGTLMFDSTHDTFAGTNVTSIVLEMSVNAATRGTGFETLRIWATTARK